MMGFGRCSLLFPYFLLPSSCSICISTSVCGRFYPYASDNRWTVKKDIRRGRKPVFHNPVACRRETESIQFQLLFLFCIFQFLFLLHFLPMRVHHLLQGHVQLKAGLKYPAYGQWQKSYCHWLLHKIWRYKMQAICGLQVLFS